MHKVLFTHGGENSKEACEHLINGGIWVRQFRESGQDKAVVYCIDKILLNQFVEPFGLTNIKVDTELRINDCYLSVALIKFWGKKLDAVLEWKRSLESSSSAS